LKTLLPLIIADRVVAANETVKTGLAVLELCALTGSIGMEG
jgi:hypothetical protein